MASFYQLEKQDEGEPEKKGADNKYYDDEGKFKWEAQSSSDEAEDEGDEDDEEREQEVEEKHEQDEDDEDNVWDELDKEEEAALK